jgi:hypothetical protein
MTDSIATIEEQPNQTLGMIMEAANALSSIGDDVEQRREESTQEPTSEKQSDHDSSDGHKVYDQDGEAAPSTSVFAADSVKNEPAAQEGVVNTSGALGLFGATQTVTEGALKPSTELEQPEGATINDAPFNYNDADGQEKRYLPDNKKPDAAPTFPEKVCSNTNENVLMFAETLLKSISCTVTHTWMYCYSS